MFYHLNLFTLSNPLLTLRIMSYIIRTPPYFYVSLTNGRHARLAPSNESTLRYTAFLKVALRLMSCGVYVVYLCMYLL